MAPWYCPIITLNLCGASWVAVVIDATAASLSSGRNRFVVQLQNRLEALLEEAHIKISSLVSDLLGVSARRMLKAIAEGQTDPATVVALADERLQATPNSYAMRSACAGS